MTTHQWFSSIAILLLLSISSFTCTESRTANIKSAVYLSPELNLKPGSVEFSYFYNIPFPKGHIGIKSVNAELISLEGASLPLDEAYIHHWAVFRYYQRTKPQNSSDDLIIVRNSGVCTKRMILGQYFGMASETRGTHTHVPDPYAFEIGNPEQVPPGYTEGWMLNAHVMDMRGVVDSQGCTECRCSLFNVTQDEAGKPLEEGYEGGFHCCYDQTQCRVKDGFVGSSRRIYLKYTVKWVDWDNSAVLPVRLYIFDVTDTPMVISSQGSSDVVEHDCKVEYSIEQCKSTAAAADGTCTDTKKTSVAIPKGGYMVYGVALQYPGGIGAALSRKDGRVICSSKPTYGKGKEVGNEAGYIVGMSTCYPQPGSMKISDGETVVVHSTYNSSVKHTGVVGFFKIMVADKLPKELGF